MATLFSDILAKGVRRGELPGRSKGAIEWYRKQAKTAAGKEITSSALLNTKERGRAKARLTGEAVYVTVVHVHVLATLSARDSRRKHTRSPRRYTVYRGVR